MTLTSPLRALSQRINRKPPLLAMYILALGLMLASPVTSDAFQQHILGIDFDPSLTREVSGNGNGIIEPGESGEIGSQISNSTGRTVTAYYIEVVAESDNIHIGTWGGSGV